MAALVPEPACPPAEYLVKAGLRAQVLLPADADYTARQDSYWSNSAKIKPACIVRPRSAQEVSTTVQTLVAAREKFAIRSGGNTQWAGSNNIEGGVTIDLGLLEWTKFDESSETVDIGPGGRWRHVFAELHQHGRAVAGGRDGSVGVAGFLLGGGKTFFTARRGFGCDDVVAYEIVLADGRLVTADAKNHDDLFQALKGGSNNFGIVTNFKMKAIRSDAVWGGLTFFPKQVIPYAIQALWEFTDDVSKNLDSNLLCFFTYLVSENCPDFKDIVLVAVYVQLEGIEKAPAYEKWLRLPSTMTTCKMTSLSEMASEYNIAPQQYYNSMLTASFKNDTRILAKALELHDELVTELKAFISDGDFVTQCLFQPLPKLFGQRSAEAGGNIMGVEHQAENGLLLVAAAMVRTPEQEAFAYPKVKAWVQAVRDFAATVENGNLGWIDLNYADQSQDPLASYGIENVKKMRDVAAKYDPTQVFQTLCPGGFKISHVKGSI